MAEQLLATDFMSSTKDGSSARGVSSTSALDVIAAERAREEAAAHDAELARLRKRERQLRWRNLKTGLLFLCGLALAAWLGFYIGKNTGLLTKHRYVKLFVTDIKGLTEGNLVSISGKKIGVVKRMDFTSLNDTNGVLLTLDIRDEFFPLISRDSRATIKSLGVLGDKYLDIQLGRDKERLADGGSLALTNEPGIEDLTASAIRTMKNVGDLTDEIKSGHGTIGKLLTTTELNDRLNTVAGNLAMLSSQLTSGKGVAGQLLTNGSLAQDLQKTVKNLNAISEKLGGSGEANLGKMLVGEGFLAKLNAVTDRTDTLITAMSLTAHSLSAYGASGQNGFYGRMNENMDALHSTLGSLDSLLTDLKKNPKRYINVSVF